MQKKLTALLLALAMLLSLLTGCGSADAPAAENDTTDSSAAETEDTAGSEDTADATLTEVPPEAKEDPVAYITDGAFSSGDTIMTVNGVEVSADTFVYWLAYQYTYASYFYAQYGTALDLTETVDENGTTIAQSLGDQAKTVATMNTLLRAKAQEAGLSLTEEQQSGMADLAENYDENTLLFYATTLPTLQQAYTDSCLASDLQEHLFGEGGEMAPTEQTLADFAEEQGTYTCRYILLDTNSLDEDDEDGREEQRLLAEQIYNQLQECSPEELEEKFTELQEEYNTADGNTDRYTFDNSASLVSGFREKVAELKPGELGMTDETDYGYFVLLRLDTELETLSESYAAATYDSLISQWMDEAQMETTEALDNLDIAACYDRLVALQDALSAQLAAEEEASTNSASEMGDDESSVDRITYTISSLPGTVDVSDKYNVYSEDNPITEEMCAEQGIDMENIKLALSLDGFDMRILRANELFENRTIEIDIRVKEGDAGEYPNDYRDLSDAEFNALASSLVSGFGIDDYSVFESDHAKFVVFNRKDSITGNTERRYATCLNGKMIYVLGRKTDSEDLSDEQIAEIEDIAKTLKAN